MVNTYVLNTNGNNPKNQNNKFALELARMGRIRSDNNVILIFALV